MTAKDYIESGLIEVYALGIATPEELASAEAAIAQFAEVKDYYLSFAASIEDQAMNNALEPSADFFAKLEQELQPTQALKAKVVDINTATPSSAGGSKNSYIGWAVAASILATFSFGMNAYLYTKLSTTENALAEALNNTGVLSENLQKAKFEQNKLNEKLMLATDPMTTRVMLSGMNSAKGAMVLAVVDPSKNMATIHMHGMPELPKDKDLQLWAIVDGKPVDLGIIKSDSDFVEHPIIANLNGAVALAVTVEDKGGHPTPKGEMVLMGKIGV